MCTCDGPILSVVPEKEVYGIHIKTTQSLTSNKSCAQRKCAASLQTNICEKGASKSDMTIAIFKHIVSGVICVTQSSLQHTLNQAA